MKMRMLLTLLARPQQPTTSGLLLYLCVASIAVSRLLVKSYKRSLNTNKSQLNNYFKSVAVVIH